MLSSQDRTILGRGICLGLVSLCSMKHAKRGKPWSGPWVEGYRGEGFRLWPSLSGKQRRDRAKERARMNAQHSALGPGDP